MTAGRPWTCGMKRRRYPMRIWPRATRTEVSSSDSFASTAKRETQRRSSKRAHPPSRKEDMMSETGPAVGTYTDIRQYLDELDQRDLLVRVDRKTNKDTEIMPLVRWQFRGLDQDQRKGCS